MEGRKMSKQADQLDKVFMAPRGDCVERLRAVLLALEGEKPKKRARKMAQVTSASSRCGRSIPIKRHKHRRQSIGNARVS
jgi:hypothetical protein